MTENAVEGPPVTIHVTDYENKAMILPGFPHLH